MKAFFPSMLASYLVGLATGSSEVQIFRDDFRGRLDQGWTWIRENPQAWRTTESGLEIRIEPGNMWGPANNARNLLLRKIGNFEGKNLEASVTVENRPTEQYEQVDLVWYYDDGHMVKIGQELVDGKLSIVMGREEKDRTRTIAIIPLDAFRVRLRLTVNDNLIQGHFRKAGSEKWEKAGQCDLPVQGHPCITIQCYQGPTKIERWVKITAFELRSQD